MEIKATLEPVADRIIGFENIDRRRHPRPLECAEEDVIREERSFAAEPRLELQRMADGFQLAGKLGCFGVKRLDASSSNVWLSRASRVLRK